MLVLVICKTSLWHLLDYTNTYQTYLLIYPVTNYLYFIPEKTKNKNYLYQIDIFLKSYTVYFISGDLEEKWLSNGT